MVAAFVDVITNNVSLKPFVRYKFPRSVTMNIFDFVISPKLTYLDFHPTGLMY